MNNKKIGALLLAIASTSSYAGTMGPVATPERLLLLEGGFSYSYSFYRDQVTFPESRSTLNPSGFSIHPSDFYPSNFYGGYIGASLYLPQNWLLNSRYDMYGSESKRNIYAETDIDLAPTRLSFSVDKVFGDFNSLSFGAGAGAVIENANDGNFVVSVNPLNPVSESIQGRTRIDPMVEAFAMYRFVNNFGIKVNAAYQIPLHNKFGSGDLNVNLGVNYAFAI